jgi:hypothetical protein
MEGKANMFNIKLETSPTELDDKIETFPLGCTVNMSGKRCTYLTSKRHTRRMIKGGLVGFEIHCGGG